MPDVPLIDRGRWSECWRDHSRSIISVICSECGKASITVLPPIIIDDNILTQIYEQMPYCPKCGAKMRGDTDAEPAPAG